MILRFEKELEEQFDFEFDLKTNVGLLLVALENGSINSKLRDCISMTPPIDWREHPKGDFQFDPARYVDTVVIQRELNHKRRK